MKKLYISLILGFVVLHFGIAQIKPNEKLIYAASYNMSGLMTQIAQVSMNTEIVKTSKKSFLHLTWEASTYTKWDSFFKIRDLYESYVDPLSLSPSLFKRSTNEGGYTINQKYIFGADNKSINSTSKFQNGAEQKKNVSIGNTTRDIISMVYKLRTVDFSKYKAGQVISFTLVFDEKEYPISIKLMGRETVSAGNLGKKDCYVLSIGAKTDKLRGKDKNLIWLTTDSNHTPVLVRFSIPVGTGQIALSNASGI